MCTLHTDKYVKYTCLRTLVETVSNKRKVESERKENIYKRSLMFPSTLKILPSSIPVIKIHENMLTESRKTSPVEVILHSHVT